MQTAVGPSGTWYSTIERLRESKIYFVEQPLPSEEIVEMASLRKRIGLPVIADESIYTIA